MHQHALDAFVAQTANASTPPQRVVFALAGLCLQIEHKRSGRQVQQAHARLAKHRGNWPSIVFPGERGALTAADVLRVPDGDQRDASIHEWCAVVWGTHLQNHSAIRNYLQRHGEG